ncbi:MAG: type III pantothenate kinase [Lachnospiraceae bacterium]|jgi:type III pantothenate kinase|nr:type III pantothenate kinase [Lachnospiraceae bacterium]
MLLVVDIGNTNITLGVFKGEELLSTSFRMMSKDLRTSDEYGVLISMMLQARGIEVSSITDVIIASVVPGIMHSFNNGIIKYFGIKPLIVGAGLKTGIKIVTPNPKEIGPDRIVDAAAAYSLYGGPIIVLDYGTATTYDLVGPNGTFEAGITGVGMNTAAKALWGDADMLPAIEIEKPKSILAKETISSMQAGIVYGEIGATEYIVANIIKESGYKDIKVIATGGLGKMISAETNCIDIYDPDLTLKGLKIIFDKNKKTK